MEYEDPLPLKWRLSQQKLLIWIVHFSGTQHYVIWKKLNASEEHITSIFVGCTVSQTSSLHEAGSSACCLLHSGHMFCLIFKLRKEATCSSETCFLFPNYMPLQPTTPHILLITMYYKSQPIGTCLGAVQYSPLTRSIVSELIMNQNRLKDIKRDG